MQQAVDRKLVNEDIDDAFEEPMKEFKQATSEPDYVPPIKSEGKVDPNLIQLTQNKRLQKLIPQELKQQEILYQLKEKRKDELKHMLQKDIEKAKEAQIPNHMKKKLKEDELIDTGHGEFDSWIQSMDVLDKKHFLNKIKGEKDQMLKEIEKQ